MASCEIDILEFALSFEFCDGKDIESDRVPAESEFIENR